jgi:zinc/manganese transport system substrate-binding protein
MRRVSSLFLGALGVMGALGGPRALGGQANSGDPIRVVATLPVYASLVREIGGNAVDVTSIADPREDAHFVRPKPSFARDLRGAQLFVTTGLDLELWVPALLDKAANPDVLEGGKGYVAVYPGIELLDVPPTADRSAGDIHLFGNPHLHTDPLRVLQVARNITAGLKRVDPGRSATYDEGLAGFQSRIYRHLFGDELVGVLGGEILERLALSGNFFSFIQENSHEGRPLADLLGGWLAAAAPFRDREIICYHKNWAYFEDRFQVRCAEYVEAKPGIPPTPGHTARLIELMRDQGIKVVLAADYFDRRKVESVADRGQATAVIVPFAPGGQPGVTDYFSLVDRWVHDLSAAFSGGAS